VCWCGLAALFSGLTVAIYAPGVWSMDAGLIPITVPELLRLLRDAAIPPPRRDRAHRRPWSDWRRRHQHRARQAHQRWNA